MTRKDILIKVSKETGLSERHILEVESYLWKSVKEFLSTPLDAKQGILINEFISFKPPSIKKIEWYLECKASQISKEEKEFYNNYLKILKDE
jgi:hypothetical protein